VFTAVNTAPCCDVLRLFLNPAAEASSQECNKALELILCIHTQLCKVQAQQDPSSWHELSPALVHTLVDSCKDCRVDVAHHALHCLQRGLLLGTTPLKLSGEVWETLLEQSLYPMVEALPSLGSVAPPEHTLLLNATLVFVGILVHIIEQLGGVPQFEQLWRKYLGLLASFTRLQGCAELSCKVPELLWPLLRKMCQSSCFGERDSISDSSALWRITLETGFAFSPNLSPQQFIQMATTEPPQDNVDDLVAKPEGVNSNAS